MNRYAALISVFVFPALLILPIVDELIGRRQFERLCEREAVIALSPSWREVKRAKDEYLDRVEVSGVVFTVYLSITRYSDLETGKVFLEVPKFITYGGMIFGRLGRSLGSARVCEPKDLIATMKMVKVDQLINEGKRK